MVRKVQSEFDQGLGYRSAIYIPFPQAVPLRATIDPAKCLTLSKGKCKQQSCVPACGPGAIDFEQKDEVVELDVGAIIMATGFELWDPAQESRYGYGRLDNVITSLEFERISNASGPTGGQIVCKNGEAAQVGRHPALRRQPRRELSGVLLARVLHVLAQVLAPDQGAPARDRGVRALHRHALLRQELRGVLQAAHGRGRQLRPRPRRRSHRRRPVARRSGASGGQGRRHPAGHSAGASRPTW